MDVGDPLVPLGGDTASVVARGILFLLIMALAFLAARATLGAIRSRRWGGAARHLLGHQALAPWDTGEWACGRCRSVNRAASVTCEHCRSPRRETELTFAGIPTEPDIVPDAIPAGAGAVVTLEHNEAAHRDGLNGHWRLRVNSVIVGSAARRDGALALLRAVEGAEAVLFDPTGAGYAAYALPSLIAAFEQPRLPIRTPCPERGQSRQPAEGSAVRPDGTTR
jgi:hypothetical protein